MSQILVVEDEQDLAETLCYNLRLEGHNPRMVHTGAAALRLLRDADPPDLVLLDLMLPDISGFEVCRELRRMHSAQRVSVIILTANGEEIDRVVGFEVGADDYVTKPFSIRELMLRVKAVLRRTTSNVAPKEVLQLGPFRVDAGAHRAWVDENELTLTALEFRLLSAFLQRQGQVQTREALLRDVWEMDPNVNTRTVDKHVQRLRQKLGSSGVYIDTIRGVGYRFQFEERLK